MNLTVNGKPITLEEPAAIPDLLSQLGLEPRLVVVELNGEALTPSEARQKALQNDDILEIVQIVAGG
jgi:sulfur carrier protein